MWIHKENKLFYIQSSIKKYTFFLKETEMNYQVLLFLKKHILILWQTESTANTVCAALQNCIVHID